MNCVIECSCVHEKKRFFLKCLSGALVLSQLAVMPLVEAEVFRELSLDELSEMRGKFVTREGVQFFGLSMNTEWHTPLGHHEVNMMVSLNFANAQPEADIRVSGTLGTTVNPSAGTEFPGEEALTKTSGTVQSIQASGSGNRVANQLSLNVIDPDRSTVAQGYTAEYQSHSQVSATRTSQTRSNVSDSAAQSWQGVPEGAPSSVQTGSPLQAPLPAAEQTVVVMPTSHAFQTDSGITTTVNVNGSQLGYTIQSGPDRVVQKIGINDIHNTRQLVQSVQLHGDAHHVVNNIKMDVGLAAGRESRGTALRLHESLIGIL